MTDPSNITELMQLLQSGDASANEEAFKFLYQPLRRIAAARMRKERNGHTLQPTALVHEAYEKMIGLNNMKWQNKAHFLAVASQVMRHILADYARQKSSLRRGGSYKHEHATDTLAVSPGMNVEILDLERALKRLGEMDLRQARVIEFRYFGGMNEEEVAHVLGVSVRTVRRDWIIARAWLFGELQSFATRTPGLGLP